MGNSTHAQNKTSRRNFLVNTGALSLGATGLAMGATEN